MSMIFLGINEDFEGSKATSLLVPCRTVVVAVRALSNNKTLQMLEVLPAFPMEQE